ncbi:hypothetical protein BDZ45DRAFT_288460 [Acephala macrosclerotiorum]|nr:hypothetical protein BDZ45DRAFT_288460 [Acephala macrosclerotiorum]
MAQKSFLEQRRFANAISIVVCISCSCFDRIPPLFLQSPSSLLNAQPFSLFFQTLPLLRSSFLHVKRILRRRSDILTWLAPESRPKCTYPHTGSSHVTLFQ